MKDPIHNKTMNLMSGKIIPAKRTYTVRLVAPDDGDKWQIYHCPDCRNPIAQYRGSLIEEIPGEVPYAYPVKIQCKNPNCGRKIIFQEVIEQVL